MTKYKCGHESEVIIMDSNPLSISAYLNWKDTVGFDGNKSKCFDCYCKEEKKMGTKEYTYDEMMQWKQEELDLPVKQRWFKHKTKPIYKN